MRKLAFLILIIASRNSFAYDRVALVVGNSQYASAALKNPVRDANAVAEALRRTHFDVDLLLNATQKSMDEAIVTFGRKLKPGDVGLFFYAGHGIQSKGQNFLLPVDVELADETELKYKTVNVGMVLDAMENAQNGLNIVILDACRDNPLARSFRSATRGLARQQQVPNGTLLAYSTSPGEVAEDGFGRNSPFTLSFVKALREPGLAVEQVFKQTAKSVKTMTAGRQTPWLSSSFTEDFYFTEAQPPRTVIADTNNDADAVWQTIKDSREITLLRRFVLQYPASPHKTDAENAIARLNEKNRPPPLLPAAAVLAGAAPTAPLRLNVNQNRPVIATTIPKTQILDAAAKQRLLGEHRFSLQWISWERFGKATVDEKDGILYLHGRQIDPSDKSRYITIEGVITKVEQTSFAFEGKIDIDTGRVCTRQGKMTFRTTGHPRYWRLKEMDSPCGVETDYVDIFVR